MSIQDLAGASAFFSSALLLALVASVFTGKVPALALLGVASVGLLRALCL
ncbi:hypothetical protein LNV08_00260 [Paucibacter sp. TC2R-5]|nr:hypothetical protein [Paucibacter sp. TC2R-5]MCV2357407.1 hypothetical protein [Paucibacter sp. TC2R-5]